MEDFTIEKAMALRSRCKELGGKAIQGGIVPMAIEHIRTLNGVYTAFDREGEQLVCYHHDSGRIMRLPESALTSELKRRERGDTMSEKEGLDLSTAAGVGLDAIAKKLKEVYNG